MLILTIVLCNSTLINLHQKLAKNKCLFSPGWNTPGDFSNYLGGENMDRKKIIEKALIDGSFSNININKDDDNIILEIFENTILRNEFELGSLTISQLFYNLLFKIEDNDKIEYGSIKDTEKIEHYSIKDFERNRINTEKILKILDNKTITIIKERNWENLYKLIDAFSSHSDLFTDLLITITSNILKNHLTSKVCEIFEYLDNGNNLYFMCDAYLPSLEYGIEKNEKDFIKMIYSDFIKRFKFDIENNIATEIESNIIQLFVEKKQDSFLIEMLGIALTNNSIWIFIESYDLIYDLESSYAKKIIEKLIKKYPKYILLYTTLFRNMAINKDLIKTKEIFEIVTEKNKINDFLNLIVNFYIRKNDSYSERISILCSLMKINILDRKIKKKIEHLTFPFLQKKDKYYSELLHKARNEERNKIISTLSHSLKNMITTVIDPLENLKKEKEFKPLVIENAIRGANLIREIVNAMNFSFKGSFEDFNYDAANNLGKDSKDFQTMFLESLKYSVSNMFDGKYFKEFLDNYFPTKKIFLEAKSKWEEISQTDDLIKLTGFLNKYFFKTEFNFEVAEKIKIGNDKNSAVKMLILIQELVFNAIKYSGFVPKEKRKLRIQFSKTNSFISIKVQNNFKPKVKTKTTGLGNVVIKNFAEMLNTKPKIDTKNDLYSVKITFENLWRKKT